MASRKLYIAIAKVFSEELKEIAPLGTAIERRNSIEQLATGLAVVLKSDNPSFDRTKFLEACGVNK